VTDSSGNLFAAQFQTDEEVGFQGSTPSEAQNGKKTEDMLGEVP